MPLQFRCVFCHQLLGIARRKAGQRIECPTCGRPIVVPSNALKTEVGAQGGSPSVNPILERSDFSRILQPPTPVPVASPVTESSEAPLPLEAPRGDFGLDLIDVEAVPGKGAVAMAKPVAVPPPRGLFLTPVLVTVLGLAWLLLVVAAFVVGVLVGRSLTATV